MMKTLFPHMYDCPERTTFMAGIAYSVICFWTFPFLMLFLSQGFSDATSQSWFEIVYHVINFAIVLRIFWTYLKDSFFNVEFGLSKFLATASVCALLIIIYTSALLLIGRYTASEEFMVFASGTIPMVEMEVFNYTSNLIQVNPIAGAVCIILLAPVTTSCIYYASVFAPVCSARPWLAYLIMPLVLAIPRICNAMTFWPPQEELHLYLAQLPIHLIACYAYQKTDSVWTPIAVHAVVNLVGCAFYLFVF